MAGLSQTIWGGGGTNSGSVNQAPPQNYYDEGLATQQAQLALAPQQYAAYNTYAPQYAQTDVNTLGSSLFGSGYTGTISDINQKLTDQANQQTTASNTSLRNANQADVASLAPQIQAQLQAANPQFYAQLGAQAAAAARGIQTSPYESQMGGLANSSTFSPVSLNGINAPTVTNSNINAPNSIYAQQVRAPGSNGTLNTLAGQYQNQPGLSATQTTADQTAQNLLAQGGNLSPSELRNVQQASRAGFAARGLDGSNASIVDEAMQTDTAQRARLLQNVGAAESIEGQSQAQRQQQQQFGLGVSGQYQNYGQLGLQAQTANQGANLQSGLANAQFDYNTQLSNQTAGLQAQTANAGFNYAAQSDNNQNILNQQAANLASQNQQYSQLGQLTQLDYQRQLQNFNLGQQSLSNYAGAIFDPQAAVLGQNSTNVGMNGSLFGQGASTTSNNANVANQFNPYNPYAGSMYNTNANITSQGNIASAANKTSQINNVVSSDASTVNAVIGKI